MDFVGSEMGIQEKLHQLWERQSQLKKAIEIEETTLAKDDGLSSNRQYLYSQDELTKVSDRRDRALEELDVKFNGFKESREARIKAIQEETERHIEAYRAKKELEIATIQKEIEVKENLHTEKRAAVEKRYDDLSKGYSETIKRIEENSGTPQSIAFRRKKTELDLVNQQVIETQMLLEKAHEQTKKRFEEQRKKNEADVLRQEREQKERDLAIFNAQRAAEKEKDRAKEEAREMRKRKLREALRACKCEDDVWKVEQDTDYIDWEDEEMLADYKKRFKQPQQQNHIVETAPGPARLLTSTLIRGKMTDRERAAQRTI